MSTTLALMPVVTAVPVGHFIWFQVRLITRASYVAAVDEDLLRAPTQSIDCGAQNSAFQIIDLTSLNRELAGRTERPG